jgi:hypothetical protein
MIDVTIKEEQLERTIQRARERKIIVPTFRQQRNPALIPEKISRCQNHRSCGQMVSHGFP